jgi:protein CpxP
MMQMKRLWVAVLGLVAAVALAAPAVYAGQQTGTYNPPQAGTRGHRGPGAPGFEGPMGMRGAWSQLDLTDAQKAQLKQVRANHRDAIVQLSKQLATMRQQLNEAENGSTFDEDLATKQLSAMAGIEAKLMGERFRERQESEAVLTDAQKAQLQQLQEQMKANWASRRAAHGPPNK